MVAMHVGPGTHSDLILTGGPILTMDAARRRVEAILIHDNMIGAAGDLADVRRAAPGATVADLAGATVTPGFVDAHAHLGAMTYLLGTVDCSAAAAPTMAVVLDRLRAASHGTSVPGDWVAGHSFSEAGVAERRMLSRADLDAAVPDRPCIVFHRSLHACILNSPALEAAGLDLPDDPRHGKLGRDASGRPDGSVYEAPMFALFARRSAEFLASVGRDVRTTLVRDAASVFLAEGVTTLMDADLPGVGGLRALIEADAAGALPLRVVAMINEADSAWALETGLFGFGSDRLRIGAIKVFSDGGMSSRTAAVDRPYDLPPYGRGVLFHDAAQLDAIIRRAETAGTQVAIHSQGDRAIATVMDAFEAVIGTGSGNPLRHRIEHGGMLVAPLLARAAAIGIHVVSQPGFISLLGDVWLASFGEPTKEFYPFRSIRAAGLRVGGSSDAPVIPPSVRRGLRDAVERRTDGGVVIGEAERLTATEALELYTRDAAFLSRIDDRVGSLEPGRYADLVVLDGDPTSIDPADLLDVPILQTVVGGRSVFGAGPV